MSIYDHDGDPWNLDKKNTTGCMGSVAIYAFGFLWGMIVGALIF